MQQEDELGTSAHIKVCEGELGLEEEEEEKWSIS